MRLAITLPSFLLCLVIAIPELTHAATQDHELYVKARKALQQGKYDRAITLLSGAILINPYDHRYFNDRGVAHKRQGRLNLALNDYADALRIKPDSADALNNRGVVYLQRGQFKKAVEDFTSALKRDKQKSRYWTNRGLAYLKDGLVDLAIEDLRQAITAGSADSRTYYYLAQALEAKGERQNALRMYELTSKKSKGTSFATLIKKKKQSLRTNKTLPARIPAVALKKEPSPQTTELVVASSSNSQRTKRRKVSRYHDKPKLLETAIHRNPIASTPKDMSTETFSDLREKLVKSATQKFPRNVSRIFLQALDFLARAQNRKALVRFEDALKLAERKKNRFASAWCTLQIGRIYSQTNQHIIAVRHFESALIEFHRMKKHDEFLVTLALLARSNLAMRKNRMASKQFSVASKKAHQAGYHILALALEDSFRRIKLFSKPGLEVFALHEQEVKKQVHMPHDRSLNGKRLLNIGQWQTFKEHSRKQLNTSNTVARIVRGERKPYLVSLNSDNLQQPRRQIFVLPKGQNRNEKLIRSYLRTIKKLRNRDDQANMIVVLEKLASKYAELKHSGRALRCLTVSLALREKLCLQQGVEKVFYAIGSMYEELNKPVLAMENFARASIPESGWKGSRVSRAAMRRTRKLAQNWEWNSDEVIQNLEHYWHARANRSVKKEAQAVHKLVRFYQGAKLYSDAQRHLEIMKSVNLAYKAQTLAKIGQVQEARSMLASALRRLKQLDYSRYLQLVRTQQNLAGLVNSNRVSRRF